MRPALPALPRPAGRARRGTALVALGTLALVGAAPGVALAADGDVAPASDAAGATQDVVLPAVDQVDQVVVGAPSSAAVGEAPTDEVPADEVPADEVPADEVPADEVPAHEVPTEEAPTDQVPTEEVPAAQEPTDEAPTDEEPPVLEPPFELPEACEAVEGCYGTGKVGVELTSPDGAPVAGAVVEMDVAGTSPEPEWTGETGADGRIPGDVVFDGAETVTFRIVSLPAGAMVAGPAAQTFGPCLADESAFPFAFCGYDFAPEIVRAYRVLDVRATDEAGAPVAGATFELWGTPAHAVDPRAEHPPVDGLPSEPPATGVRALAAPAPDGLVRLGSSTSDAAGRVSIGRVVPGAYELRATAVPAAYALPDATVPVALDQVLTVAEAEVPVAVRVALRGLAAPAVTPVATPAAPVAAAGARAAVAPARTARTGALAATGADAAPLGGVAAGLLALGLGSLALARRGARRA